ncbi:MAG: GNAT family N-acetyltransferase [Candidatus Hydrogenedentes bacterium]|nr:GNAT family N-acetyltransferase [Candidatus Hydrogenedentota bacterium]
MGLSVATDLVVRPAADDEELHLANELMAKSNVGDTAASMRWLESQAASYPGLPPEHTRIAVLDGEIAGALRLTTETMRIGEARLKVGGLGWMTTAPRHRHRGVCTQLLQGTLKYMYEHRCHVSMLFGIPNFYRRFGYATTLASYTITLDAAEAASSLSGAYKIRKVKPGDIAAIQKMHNAADSNVACSLVRSSAHLKRKWDRFKTAKVFTSQQGKVLAYALTELDERALLVHEAAADDPAAALDVIAHCARLAQDNYKPRIRFSIPPEHPFAHLLARYDSIHEMHLARDRGGMLAFVDLGEALESMVPEWEGLVAHSVVADRHCEATLLVEGTSYRLRAHHGAVDVAESAGKNKFSLSRADLMRLLTGYSHFEDVFQQERRLIAADARAFLAAIFPKRNPYVHTFDRL